MRLVFVKSRSFEFCAAMERSNKRSSILKRPAEDSSPSFTRSKRRISFSEKKNVKVFAPGTGGVTIWIKSYEESHKESAEVVAANSTKGTFHCGPIATPELMRLRNNKIISRVPKTISSKAKKPKGVENVPPGNIANEEEEEEQLCRKFCEGMDISLSASEMKHLKVEERMPLRPITQHSKKIEEAENYVSPQSSLTFQSPEKIYCSFAVTNNDLKALRKYNNDKKLDLTLADIVRDYEKNRNHQSNNPNESLTPMDMVNEASASSAHAMGNTSEPKKETMFNLENMELVSIQKTPNKRSTIYYCDSLELSLKNNEKQHILFSRLKPLDTPYEIQEESLVEDCDKENREVGVDNSDMELSFASIADSMKFESQKNSEMKAHSMHDVNNARNKYINKENRGYIGNEDFMDLSECKSAVQTINRVQKQLSVHNFTPQKESDLVKIDISLSPGALAHSIQVKPSRNQQTKWSPTSASDSSCNEYLPKKNVILSAKRQTIYDQCDLDISMQVETTKIAESDDRVPPQKESDLVKMDISLSPGALPHSIQVKPSRNQQTKWSPTSASDSSCNEYLPKKNVILSAKRQTIYDQCDLDISMQAETAKIAESDDMVPVDDYGGINCNLKNNGENNTISSIKRQMSCSSVNLDLTIQNDLKDSKNGEINNEQTMDTINTITSVKNNIERHIEPFNRNEKPSCSLIKTKKTPNRDEYSAKEPMTLTLHKSQSSPNKTLNILNKSCGKNANNSVQIFDFSIKEGAKSSELDNTQSLKLTERKMETNSLGNIDLSGCEQLDQTSEVIFYDISSSNSTIDMGIEQLRNAEIVTETSSEIPRLSRASSCHTNTTISTFSANTTQALCNFDLSKITKKGYKPNLTTTSDFKCKDTSFANSYDYIPPMSPPVSTADKMQEISLSIGNLNLDCTSKDVNLKNDNCDNKLKSQQTIESKSRIDRRKSFCSRCKVCDCKPNTGESKSDNSTFSWKFEAPSQPCKVDFSGYEKFQNMPSIRDILDAHKRRRESLNFESYEESVLCPTVPSLDFLLENYEKQYKLQVEKELPIGAIFPLIPSLEILLSNKLQSEHFGWKLNTLCMPVGIMEFRHNIISRVTLILKYSPNSFYSNEDKLIFEKVQLKISKLYGNSSPLDRIIENEICVKAPYDLINYCSYFNDLFSFLSFMNNICEKAVQLGKELFRRVVRFNSSLQKDTSDVCFIKKRVLYTPRCNQKGLMSTQDFLVRVRNIENISHTDIMFPPLSDFKEKICSIPQGLEFLTRFFFDPISYLKTE